MAGDTNSNIFINIDTSQAMAQLRLLEKELTALNRSLIVGTKAAAAAQAKYAQSLLHNVNATGQWTASMTRMSTASEQFATNLDRQRLSLKEYFRYGAASTKTFGKMFGREFDTIEKLVDKRVKTLQQQYVQLGRDAQGAMNSMKFTPKSLNMQNLTTQLMMATQRQQIMNKLIDDGSTKLLNFGKNTQWAGRQLMVGFTIPLMLFGTQAIKVFKEIETQVIRFKKVYGDIFTDQGATEAALKNIRALADEYTKYGLTVADTIKTAADAAAAGFSGKGLENLVEQTNKLAVLGGVTQEKALETTIALKNAFQIDTGAMAGTIDFLNAVENQTVVALEDLTEAIPKVAPVIQQLGGDVKDLAYFMAAMQEGGISAAQGANALKSGLASLINPSNAASKAAAAVGINIKGIVEANQGNLRNTVTGFAQALQPLTDLERSRVIEKVFGKYQFARISALLNNLGREGTQAARVLQLTNASVEELAILSQRELKIQADSPMNKLAGSIERFKKSIAPIGELFAKVFTPVIEFIAKMAEKFNNLPEGIKKAIGIITVVVGGLGPIFLMTFGLLANAVANSVKGVQVLRKGYQQLAAGSTDAALKTQYLSQEELENISISNALYSKHQQLSAAYALESTALSSLMSVYARANATMGSFAATNPGMFMPRGGVVLPRKFAKGTTSVPGPKGAGDVIPAMLSPGESVIPTKQTQKYAGFINQIIQDKVPGFMAGRVGAFPAFGAAANVGRAVSTRGAIGASAPVISIASGSLTRPGLSGIRFTEGADGLVSVTVGSQSFRVRKEKVDELKSLLKDNQTWLESKGRLPGGPVSTKKGYADTTEGKLEHVLRTRLAGKDVLSPREVFSKLQKYDASKVRAVPKELKALRTRYKNSPIYKELVKTHKDEVKNLKLLSQTKGNPYGLTPDDLLKIQGAQGANAKEFRYSGALSHRFTDRQVGELPGLTQYKRNSPSNVFEEQSFLNKYFQDISKTSLGGMHISRRDQAQAALKMILDKPASKRSAIEKAVHATLDKRLASGYYEKFGAKTNQLSLLKDAGLTNSQIKELPRTGVPGFARGVVSLGMPIPFKTISKNRSMISDSVPGFIRGIAAVPRPVRTQNKQSQSVGRATEKELNIADFDKDKKGATPGGFRDISGKKYYVKQLKSGPEATSEVIASNLLSKFGGNAVPLQMFDKNIVGSRFIPTVKQSTKNSLDSWIGKQKDPKAAVKKLFLSYKRYATKDAVFNSLIGNVDTHAGNVMFDQKTGRFVNLDIGNSALAGFRGIQKPSDLLQKDVGDLKERVFKAAASHLSKKEIDALAKEIGITIPKNAKPRKINIKKQINNLADILGFDLTKTSTTVTSTNPSQNKFIQELIKQNPELSQLFDFGKLTSTSGKTFQEALQTVFTRMKNAQKDPFLYLSNGIFSVPGPKGAGDIQPAMLSPGEAVIPAKQSAKYMPLIQSMIADNVPGFEASNVTPWTGNPGSWRTDSSGDPVKDTPPAGTRSPDRVERAIDKFFDKPRVKKLGERIDKFAAQMSKATPKVADLGKTADKTTESFGKDKTRGFRGFLTGYGNVSPTVTNEDGTTRAATASERTNQRQMNRMNFTQKMMPMQMAGMMIPMAAGMVAQKNPEGAIAKNMNAIMMLSMLTMLLPMLNSPLKLLAATAVGLIAVFKMQAATIKKNIIEGQKQAESMTMTTKQLEELGKITGKVSITQVAQAKRAGRNTDIVPVSMEFGNNVISNSDFGKNLKKSFDTSMATLGSGPAVDSLVNQLGTAVSQGVLDRGQAESIAVALTRNLKDAKLELDVRGKLIQLLGPNGENILNNPLQVQLDLMASGERLQQAALDNMNLVAKQQTGINTKTEIAQLGAGAIGGGLLGARAGVQAANMVQMGSNAAAIARSEAAIAKATTEMTKVGKALAVARAVRTGGQVASLATGATGVGIVPGAIGLAVSTVIFGGIEAAIRSWQKGKEKAAIGKSAGMLQGIVSQNVAASQASIDALTSQYDSAIANLELKKKTLKTEKERTAVDEQIRDLESKKQGGLQTLRSKQANMLKTSADMLDQVSGPSIFEKISPLGSGRGAVRDKYMEAFAVGMQDKFKDNAPLKAQAAALQAELDAIGNDKITLEISTLVTSDVLAPAEASTLVNTLTTMGGDVQKRLEAIVSVQGTEGVQRLSTILTMLPNENNQRQLVFAIKNMDKADADETFSAIEELGKIPDYIGIDLNIETQKNNIVDLKARGKEIDALKKKFPNGQINLNALVKMQEEAGGPEKNLTLDAAIQQWTAISKLPKELQFQAMITIGSITESDSFDKILDRELESAFYAKNPDLNYSFVDPKREAAKKAALAAFKKDADNISEATSKYFSKVAPQLFGVGTVDDSKKGGATGNTNTGPTRDDSFLFDLAQRLKLVKEGAFDALKPLESLKKFLEDGGKKSINPGLDDQRGAIKQIEAAAKSAGIAIDKDFMEIIRGLDAEQFVLWSKTLFDISKNGRIKGLKDDFIIINEGFRKATIGGYIQDVKDASKEIEDQIVAHKALTDEGYNSIEIQKILQNATLTAKIAAQGGLKATKEEQAELNKEIQKTINLNYELSNIKLNENIAETKMQIEAYNRLSAAGVKQEVILEILKDKNNAWAIASADGTINTVDKFGDLINKTKEYSDLLELIRKQTLTFEQKTQDAIDANISALDLQAKTLQNQFDLDNFQLKADIKIAEGEVEKINKDIEKEQDKIDKINLELKYDPNIGQNLLDDLQEEINDAQRKIEFDFDRPIQKLQDRSTILSNDLTLIDKAADEINEKYDKQEEALSKISQLNSDIAAQEKSRISLADALSQGDISAAAQMIQEMRANAAESANRSARDLLETRRKSEIENLRSASGMTKKQIQEEQFRIEQQIFALEQQSKIAKEAIIKIEDRIYNITELREAKLLDIRNIETVIDGFKFNQLATAQSKLDALQGELDKNQAILDAKLLAIDKEKLGWDSVQLKLDAYKDELKKINDGPLKTMKEIVDSIALALSQITSSKFKPTSPFITSKEAQEAADAAARAAYEASERAAYEAAALGFSAAGSLLDDGDRGITAAQQAANDAAAKAAWAASEIARTEIVTATNIKSLNKAVAEAQGILSPETIAVNMARALTKSESMTQAVGGTAAALSAARYTGQAMRYAEMVGKSSGGMINPKYFAAGGYSRGTDIVPAMLTPGEFVMSRYAVSSYGVDKMKAINSGTYEGEKVYNYNLSVNVKSDSNPDEIARVVIKQIQQLDNQKIRKQAN